MALSILGFRKMGGHGPEEVGDGNPLPVAVMEQRQPGGLVLASLRSQDFVSYLAATGRVFESSDADQNDMVTGQTSFADTTPTFLVDVPAGVTCIPLFLSLSQSGSVAGGDITLAIEKAGTKRYSSGGTSEKVFNSRTGAGLGNRCKLYSGATGSAGYGIRMAGVTLGPDVSPAEGVINEFVWTPASALDFIDGPGAWLVYTYAGTTGPTWLWTLKWAEVLTSELPTSEVL